MRHLYQLVIYIYFWTPLPRCEENTNSYIFIRVTDKLATLEVGIYLLTI